MHITNTHTLKAFICTLFFSLIFLISCKPELTQEIIIEIKPGQEIGANYPQAEFDLDLDSTLKVIISRLDQIGAYYGAEQIKKADTDKYLYSIGFPEKANLESLQRIISNPGKLGFWETHRVHELISTFSQASFEGILAKLQVPGNYGPIVGAFHKRDTATINNMIDSISVYLPRSLKLFWGMKPEDEKDTLYTLYALKGTGFRNGPAMSGEYIVRVKAEPSRHGSSWIVSMDMNPEGASRWTNLTGANIGNCIAIVLNDKVYSAPMVNDRIEGGRSSITGNFTQLEAEEMAAIVGGGQLPQKVEVIIE